MCLLYHTIKLRSIDCDCLLGVCERTRFCLGVHAIDRHQILNNKFDCLLTFAIATLFPRMDGLRAVDLLQLLQERFVILTGGRDQRGGPILSFPSTPRRDRVKPDDIRRVLTYLFGLPRYYDSFFRLRDTQSSI